MIKWNISNNLWSAMCVFSPSSAPFFPIATQPRLRKQTVRGLLFSPFSSLHIYLTFKICILVESFDCWIRYNGSHGGYVHFLSSLIEKSLSLQLKLTPIFLFDTSALAFTKNGIKPEVVQTPLTHLDSTPEMATMIPINGQRILGELLSYDYIRNTGVPIQSYAVTNEAGTLYGSLNYNELATVHGFETVGTFNTPNQLLSDCLSLTKSSCFTVCHQACLFEHWRCLSKILSLLMA